MQRLLFLLPKSEYRFPVQSESVVFLKILYKKYYFLFQQKYKIVAADRKREINFPLFLEMLLHSTESFDKDFEYILFALVSVLDIDRDTGSRMPAER